jgi:hypothetical protein
MRHGRRRPYTVLGVSRLPCSRSGCPNRASHQWQVCADANVFRPLCRACDLEINRLVLEFMGDPDAPAKLARYRDRLGLPS